MKDGLYCNSLKLPIKDALVFQHMKKNLLVSIVTTMEAYLSEVFISAINNKDDDKYLRKFILAYDKYKDEKVKFNELFIQLASIREKVNKDLKEISFHNLYEASKLFKAILDIQMFPDEELPFVNGFKEIVKKRHDIVHRNGKSKDGKEITLNLHQIDIAIGSMNNLIADIDTSVTKLFKVLKNG